MPRTALLPLLLAGAASVGASLAPGDCAVVGFSVAESDFAVLLLAPLPPNTQLFVTDCGVRADGSLRTSAEGIVAFSSADGARPGAVLSRGNFSKVQRSIKLKSHDQLIVFVGSPQAPKYVCALQSYQSGGELAWQRDATDDATSALPPGLADGNSGGESALAIPAVERAASYDVHGAPYMSRGNQHMLRKLVHVAKHWVYSAGPLPRSEDFVLTMHEPAGPLPFVLCWGLVAFMGWLHHMRYIDLWQRPPLDEEDEHKRE